VSYLEQRRKIKRDAKFPMPKHRLTSPIFDPGLRLRTHAEYFPVCSFENITETLSNWEFFSFCLIFTFKVAVSKQNKRVHLVTIQIFPNVVSSAEKLKITFQTIESVTGIPPIDHLLMFFVPGSAFSEPAF
jgi:hypothetical protein